MKIKYTGLSLLITILLVFFSSTSLCAQNITIKEHDALYGRQKLFPTELNKKRLYGSIAVTSALYAGSMAGLYSLWYADYPSSGFHTFNDWNEWQQMDKLGHMTTSYYVGRLGYDILRWSGVDEKRATLFGGPLGFLYLGTVELFDGFSEGWGFSWGDIAFNSMGTALFMGQQLAWQEQRITMKFSYHQTNFPQYRPDLLGENWMQQVLKDYNGQTIWFSVNPESMLNKNTFLPDWLNIAFGLGATGMTGASSNSRFYNGTPIPPFDRYRQYYLTVDVDLSRIKTRSAFLAGLFEVLNCIKIPAPTLEFSKQGVKGHWLYF